MRISNSLRVPSSWQPHPKYRADDETIAVSIRCASTLYDEISGLAAISGRSTTKEIAGRLEYSLIMKKGFPKLMNDVLETIGRSAVFRFDVWSQQKMSNPFLIIVGPSGTGKSVLVSMLAQSAVIKEGRRVRVFTEQCSDSNDMAALSLNELKCNNPDRVTIHSYDTATDYMHDDELVFYDSGVKTIKALDDFQEGQPFPACISLQSFEDIEGAKLQYLLDNTHHIVLCGSVNNIRHSPISVNVLMNKNNDARYLSLSRSISDKYNTDYLLKHFDEVA